MTLYGVAILLLISSQKLPNLFIRRMCPHAFGHKVYFIICLKQNTESCVGCEMKASQEIAGALMSFYKKIKNGLSFLMTSMALEPLQVVFFLGLQSLQYTACAVYFMHEMQWYSSCLLKEKIPDQIWGKCFMTLWMHQNVKSLKEE